MKFLFPSPLGGEGLGVRGGIRNGFLTSSLLREGVVEDRAREKGSHIPNSVSSHKYSLPHVPPLTPHPSPPRGAGNLALKFGMILMIGLIPLFAHGCHKDDLDNEPVVAIPDEQRAGGPSQGK